ncbi:PIN domain-containing protein [Microbacterium sp. KUDC0406]|uniref:PIN domain-containing protein n=1 Tax=Microbacterium sp. KUDC0406 TaxID=2909588 RepID=UPI001F34B902|nr:PIN domain-containing protein [Microbacterium sp. KUDC0406]UJP09568.1 PIN domain-containing protein [Microbacterium sp. KUDC0406]
MMLLDTNALIRIDDLRLPDDRAFLSAITLTELRFSVESAADPRTRRLRLEHITRAEALFSPDWLPFDRRAAEGAGRLSAIVSPRRPAHARSRDLLLAGHAYALGARLVTLNPKDFELVADEVEIVVPRLQR